MEKARPSSRTRPWKMPRVVVSGVVSMILLFGMGEGTAAGLRRRRRAQAQGVQVVGFDLVDPVEQRVEVVVDGDMPS